ncbi:MAG: hypothetical protein WC934_12155 [Acidithiobacillus sp.]|jgi:hypothetical protein|uniref:hypothetical protein n=1 Tax=Acidithiobacillus sp. TaxID=1872118 RepID=UPI00355DF87A
MYIYNIVLDDHEGSSTTQICHEKEFSQNEFEDILVKCFSKIALFEVPEIQEKFERFLNENHCLLLPARIDFSDIYYSRIFLQELEKYGFKKLKFTASIGVFCSDCIFGKYTNESVFEYKLCNFAKKLFKKSVPQWFTFVKHFDSIRKKRRDDNLKKEKS